MTDVADDRRLYHGVAMDKALDGRFTFDGKRIAYQTGDTVGSALHRAGVRTISRSMKYHRPRGLYCNVGSCASCLVDVDGVPNLPACATNPQDGMVVASQNRIGSAKRDLLAVTDAAFPDGFDPHGAFTRPRIVNNLFLRAVRFMSGWGKAPKPGTQTHSTTPKRHCIRVDEIIIGGGSAGAQRAAATSPTSNVLVVDEQHNPIEVPGHVTTWTDALAFGIYDGTVAVRRGQDLWEVTAERVTLCTGSHDDWPLFDGNDRPGILSLRGASRLLAQNVLPGKVVVGHGDALPDAFVQTLRETGGEVVAEGMVEEAVGVPVRKVRMAGAWHQCDAVVCNLPGVPRIELFQQAGCALEWRDDQLRPVVDEHGMTTVKRFYSGGVE